MSAPFAPSPKLREYLDWARTEKKCEVKEGHCGTKPLITIIAPSGKSVRIVGLLDTKTLSHSHVSHLDRRLDLECPFPKTPEPYT